MALRPEGSHPEERLLPPRTVRVLRGEAELAEARQRAEEGAKRLHDRLAARAARDEWMVEHVARGETFRSALPPVTALRAEGPRRRGSSAA